MWAPAPPRVPLRPGELHVWRADLRAFPIPPDVLSPEECARAARFRHDHDRADFARSHAALRILLAGYTGIAPGALRFQTARHGKPLLDSIHGSDLQFSLSHSGGLALLAFSSGCEVGVDIECFSGELDVLLIAARWFPPEEAGRIRALPSQRRRAEFSRLWARHEAYAKATGTGLGDGLRASPAPGWLVEDLDAGPGCAAAVAVHATAVRLLTWEFPAA